MTQKRETKKRHILDAAMRVFAEKGYHYATVEAIAKEAGIAKGSVHAYFENKLDMLLTLVVLFWQKINEVNTAKLLQHSDPLQALKAVLATFQDILLHDSHSLYWGKILQEGLPQLHTLKSQQLRQKQMEIEGEQKKLTATIDMIIKKGQAQGRIKKTVKSAALRQLLGGASQLLIYGLFVECSRKSCIGYDKNDVKHTLDELIDTFAV